MKATEFISRACFAWSALLIATSLLGIAVPEAVAQGARAAAPVSPMIKGSPSTPGTARCAIDPVRDIGVMQRDPPYVNAYHSGKSFCGAWAPHGDDGLLHRQGIQRFIRNGRTYLVVSNSTVRPQRPGIEVIELASVAPGREYLGRNATPDSRPLCGDRIIAYLPGTSHNLDHAGGIQIMGSYVAVPFENTDDQFVAGFQIADLSDPWKPAWISRVSRERGEVENAGAASLIRLADERYMVLVFGHDADDVEVFVSSSSAMPAPGSGSHWISMAHTKTPSNFSAYQNIQLIAGCDGRFFAVGTHKNNSSVDWVDLWSVRFSASYRPTFTKVVNRDVRCRSSSTAGQRFCDFDAGAGAYVTPDGTLAIYGVEHYDDGYPFDGTTVKLREFRP